MFNSLSSTGAILYGATEMGYVSGYTSIEKSMGRESWQFFWKNISKFTNLWNKIHDYLFFPLSLYIKKKLLTTISSQPLLIQLFHWSDKTKPSIIIKIGMSHWRFEMLSTNAFPQLHQKLTYQEEIYYNLITPDIRHTSITHLLSFLLVA